MKVITTLDEANSIKRPITIVMGNFDGVHRGHQELIKQCILESKKNNWSSCVLTFDPHPTQVIVGSERIKYLTTREQKIEIIKKLDVDYLYMMPFNMKLAYTGPEEFVINSLVKVFILKKVFIGFNYYFGKKAAGTPQLLKEYGDKYGFQVSIFQPFTIGNDIVSSTIIRRKIAEGDIEYAAKLLGYWPIMDGKVVPGHKRGRKLGFPTANFSIPEYIQMPSYGVYAVYANINGQTYPAIANIGVKPTFGSNKEMIEVHIMGLKENIYDETIKISLISKIRDERRFNSAEELMKQISRDISEAENILNDKVEFQSDKILIKSFLPNKM